MVLGNLRTDTCLRSGVVFSRSIFRTSRSETDRGGTMTNVEARVSGESRRSTRVRLKVLIEAQGIAEPLTCQGETSVVNLHGALISTAVPLRVGMRIEIHVIPTGKHAAADVVHVDPDQPRVCGIGLVKPENIWGISLPPDRPARSRSEVIHR